MAVSQTHREKLSAAFRSHLDALPAKAAVRAVVVLRPTIPALTGKRPSREGRKAVAEAMQQAAQSAVERLDKVLQAVGGRRLQDSPNALGTILVEASPAGVFQLAQSDVVTAVMEDQRISPPVRRA